MWLVWLARNAIVCGSLVGFRNQELVVHVQAPVAQCAQCAKHQPNCFSSRIDMQTVLR